jgi:hypothetical protein
MAASFSDATLKHWTPALRMTGESRVLLAGCSRLLSVLSVIESPMKEDAGDEISSLGKLLASHSGPESKVAAVRDARQAI